MSERKILLGRNGEGGKVFLTVNLDTTEKPRLSFTAESWLRNGRDTIHSGQMHDSLRADLVTREPGITDDWLTEILALWERWHLNDMRAGCEHQRAEKWNERPIDPTKPLHTYGKFVPGKLTSTWNMLAWVTRQEHPEGLLSYPCPTCGYKYGSVWLYEEIPPEVLGRLGVLLSVTEKEKA